METSALTFARPALLHALWLLPLVALLYWWAERRRRALIGRIVAPKLRNLLAGNASHVRRWFRGACVVGALALLIITMAGPRLGYDTLEVQHRGRDVIIAMDVSRSMLAPDVAPSRLQRAKLLAEDLIAELGSDRVGLVAFAGSAFLQAPLTLDHGAVLAALDELDTSVIPRGGTNIDAAIRIAEEAFGKAEGFSKALVIISDGEELDTDGLAAAKRAGAAGIRIFTVGVGSAEGSEIPLGGGDFVRDGAGKVVQSRLDSARMAEIAEAAGGFYVPLDDATVGKLTADGIGKLAESDITTNSSRRPIERYQWPLGAAVALLVLQALVGERRRRPVVAGALAIWLLTTSGGWAAPAGLSAYEQGDYEKARAEFEGRLKMEPGAPGLQLNAGTAAYRLKDFEKASEYFSRAMLAEDQALRSAAEFNLANTLFRQGENQEDKVKRITDWKDAITKYDAAIKTRPGYTEAKENKERVEKLLEELEKQQQEEEKKQEQQQKKDKKQDQQKDQKQDQKKDDHQQSGEGQQDQKDQQQGEENKDQQGNQQQQQSGDGGKDKKDQQNGQSGQDQQQGQEGDKDEPKDQGKQGEQKGDQQKGQSGQDQQQGQGGDKNEPKDQGEQGEEDQQQSGDQQNKQDQKDGQAGKQDPPPQGGDKGQEEKKDEAGEQGGKESQDKPQEQGQEGGQPGDSRPQPGQSGDQQGPVPEQLGEKKQGELRGAQPEAGQAGGEQQAQAAAEAEEEKDGEMSASQARTLLRALQGEEEKVNLLERKNFQDVSRDW